MDSVVRDSVAIAMDYMKMFMDRQSQLENLMLGVITVSMLGWGYLFGKEKIGGKGDSKNNGEESSLPTMYFIIIFAFVITCVFDVLYIMYTQNDMTVLGLEKAISSGTRPNSDYYSRLGWVTLFLYYGTAPALTLISFGALWFVWKAVKEVASETKAVRAWIIIAFVSILAAFVLVIKSILELHKIL